MGSVQAGLAELRSRANREAATRKNYQTLKYLARQIEDGRDGPRDMDKLIETTAALVDFGVPPSSLQFRSILLPLVDRLPDPEGHRASYARVLIELRAHDDRVAAAALAIDDAGETTALDGVSKVATPTDAVRLARNSAGSTRDPDVSHDNDRELDVAEEARAWVDPLWRGLRALDAYAREFSGSRRILDWCANSGSPFAWPASSKKLAMNESQTAITLYRDDRLFKVDSRLAPDGELRRKRT